MKNVEAQIDSQNNLLNSVSVTNLSNVILGLNKEQALLALSTKNLTKEQTEQILAQAGLLKNALSLTSAQAAERMSMQLNNKIESEALIRKYALITQQKLEKNSTLEVSAAKLNEAVANGTLSKSEASVIASAYGISLANDTQISSFKLLTTAIWQNVKAIAAWLISNPAGWAIMAATAIAALGASIFYLTNSVERTKKKAEKAAEAYASVQSEIKDINSELETTKSRIDELNTKHNLTLTEAEELAALKEKNIELERELRLREAIAAQKGKEANDSAIKYFSNQSTYGTAPGTIDVSGDQIDILDYQIEKISELEEYFKNTDASNKDFVYVQNERLLKFLRKETAKTIESFMEQDDSLIEGYDDGFLEKLENVYNKYDEVVNGVAHSHTNTISGILEKVDFQEDAKVLEELGSSGKLSIDILLSRFPNLVKYLDDAGVSAEELYQYIGALSNPNAIDFDDAKRQLMESSGIHDGVINDAADENIYQELKDAGLFSNESLEAYLVVKTKYSDEQTEYWNIADWKQHIEDELDSNETSITPATLFPQLTTSQESLDKFQSSVKSASDAYSTLLSGSYSSSELLDSIQAINQAVSSMGGSLNWEFIDSQSNSLEVLGNAIEYVSEQYADSILSGAGIDPDSDFGKILAENIIQAQKAATQLEAVNEQIDSLQEAYQNLTDAVDTYNQCGHITFDQLQNLLSMEPQYLACLTDENGQLQLNRQAMQNLADRRLYDAKVQAVQQAISELGTLTHHDEQKAITDSAQAFRDSVDDVSAYNMELAKTLTEAGIAAPLIRDLGAALNGAEERGASDVDIQTVINNLNAKMKLIGSVDIGNLSGASSSAAEQAETDWKSLLDKETDLLEKQLAANLITFQAYINKRRQVIKNYYLDGKITAEEYYDALESMYGSQLSLYDKAVNAVTGRIDDEIDQLNEQKEAIENSYQVKIDAIQEEIDALNKANDARKAQIDLEKAQYEAERARNQRINKVYDGSQFVYAADVEAVRDAEENLADQKTQINISRLEAQIESLEREMENATKGLDSQIEALESYKEKWNEISGIYEEQQSKLIAAEILGADWESQVLNGRLDTLRSFTEQYIALQQAQADAAANAARIKAESAAGNATGGNVGTVPAAQDLWQTGDGNVDYKHFNRDVTQIYATMAHFHGGLDEGYATAPGQSTPANRSLALLQKLAGENLLPNELPAILRHGELVITPEQQRNIIANTQRYCSLSSANSGYTSSYSSEASQIHIDSLTISCPNVTNNSGAEYILKSLERLPLDNIQHSHRRRY